MDQQGNITTNNSSMLVNLMGSSSGSMLFREFMKNCMEAILRVTSKNFNGKIICDVDPDFLKEGTMKMRIIDNGDGMTAEELLHYLGEICVEGGNKNHGQYGNYGVGARISSLPCNPCGVIYKSWKNGSGNMVLLKKKDDGQYGFHQFRVGAEYKYYRPLKMDDKHEIMKDGHGTIVIFLGEYEDENTAFKNVDGGTRQLNFAFTKRFLSIPKNIEIKVMEGRGSDTIVLRNAMPLRKLLDGSTNNKKNCSASGVTNLGNINVHWWLMTKDFVDNKSDNPYSGLAAFLFEDEIYCSVKGRANSTRLKEFGILNSHQHVYILIEPIRYKVSANVQRTSLVIDGVEELSQYWCDWSRLFYENLPIELADFVKKEARPVDLSEMKKRLAEMLKECMGILYKVIGKSSNGNSSFGNLEDENGIDRNIGGGDEGNGGIIPVKPKTRKKKILDILLGQGNVDDSDLEEKSKINASVPDVLWVSIADGSRSIDDELEDKAAQYVNNSNVLLMNADFRIYLHDIDDLVKKYSANLEEKNIIINAIRENYYFSLAESFVRLKGMCSNSQQWPAESFIKLLTPETLTAIILNKSAMNARINRTVADRIGKKIKSE